MGDLGRGKGEGRASDDGNYFFSDIWFLASESLRCCYY